MHAHLRRRLGSGIAVFGLSLVATAGTLSAAAPAAGAAVQTSPVCNNLHAAEDPATCHSGGPYGEVSWDVTGGQLVLHVTGAEGIGWSDIRVCAAYGPPSNGADCQPNDAGLLPTTAYTVEMVAPDGAGAASSDGKTYSFQPCGSEFVVRVPTAAIGGDPSDWWWAMHLAPGGGAGCGGTGTHEAFGRFHAESTTTTSDDETTTTTSDDETTTTTTDNGRQGTTTTTAGNSTASTAPSQTEGAKAQAPDAGGAVSGGGTSAVAPEVIGEKLVGPADPTVGNATLPRTGASISQLLAMAGVALFLGGGALRLGAAVERRG